MTLRQRPQPDALTRVPVVSFGLGPIGQAVARLALDHPAVELVGAVDINPAFLGRDLGEVLGSAPVGVMVQPALDAANPPAGAVLLHSTGSRLERVGSELLAAVERGLGIVSTCEELAYPWWRFPDLAAQLDTAAQKRGVGVVGTGVNPGFVMDALVLATSAACSAIERIEVTRRVDAGERRGSLQRKVGPGLSVDEFRARVRAQTLGHVGLSESVLLIADGLGWTLDGLDETIEPVLAEMDLVTPYVAARAGTVSGLHQVAQGLIQGKSVIQLDLTMALGLGPSRDAIRLVGQPAISLEIPGGVQGDQATAAIVLNTIPRLRAAPPGLRTMADLALPRAWRPSQTPPR